MNPVLGNALKTVSQALAIVCMAFLLGMVAHKGHADISVLADKHSGKEFWVELARYFLGNLGGGGKSAQSTSSDR